MPEGPADFATHAGVDVAELTEITPPRKELPSMVALLPYGEIDDFSGVSRS
jgi:hypothetical protein